MYTVAVFPSHSSPLPSWDVLSEWLTVYSHTLLINLYCPRNPNFTVGLLECSSSLTTLPWQEITVCLWHCMGTASLLCLKTQLLYTGSVPDELGGVVSGQGPGNNETDSLISHTSLANKISKEWRSCYVWLLKVHLKQLHIHSLADKCIDWMYPFTVAQLWPGVWGADGWHALEVIWDIDQHTDWCSSALTNYPVAIHSTCVQKHQVSTYTRNFNCN